MEQAIRVGITSTVRQIYFRAGLALAPGKSELAVSPVQCEALEADPRLVVTRLGEGVSPAPADAPPTQRDLDAAVGGLTGSGYLAGVATLDGKVTPLAEMKVDELRELAVEMGIPGAASMKKAELAAAIAATEVQYPVKDEAGATTEPPADPVAEGA
ncbi:Rho termination factor N-terminal domain-containing protein [Aeromonas media]|uniref:Rho termination factor N-terminal domain-containing protein n=1 Tax=Aeromonas media TaxID=651 RepID=UPI002280F261|nr:Rho termination factor N-terminal domain-containing protein [Aeromonas media]MCY9821637.1 Rho termination factor N-terminal domain-containing protein [Aeromonas media]